MTEPRLYLVTPVLIADLAAFAGDLAAVLDAADIACVNFLPPSLGSAAEDEAALRAAINRLCPIVQEREVAFLLDGLPRLARETACDGAHTCPAGPPVQETRTIVGPDAIVGYSCRDSRHLAMTGAEAGADYIVFGRQNPESAAEVAGTLDLIRWWVDLMEVPCVALGARTADDVAAYVAAGADFIAVGTAVWDHPQGPVAGMRAVVAAVDQAVDLAVDQDLDPGVETADDQATATAP